MHPPIGGAVPWVQRYGLGLLGLLSRLLLRLKLWWRQIGGTEILTPGRYVERLKNLKEVEGGVGQRFLAGAHQEVIPARADRTAAGPPAATSGIQPEDETEAPGCVDKLLALLPCCFGPQPTWPAFAGVCCGWAPPNSSTAAGAARP